MDPAVVVVEQQKSWCSEIVNTLFADNDMVLLIS